MTKKELFRALDSGAPVEVADIVSRCVYQGRVVAVRISREQDGTRTYGPEVADPCGHSIMCPKLENVRLAKNDSSETPSVSLRSTAPSKREPLAGREPTQL